MLQFMRQRASSWMIKAILSIIVLAFIFMGVGNFRDQNNVTAATVNGDKISYTEFQERYYVLLDTAKQQFGNQLDDKILDALNLKERAMDQLISETVLLQKAKALGFQVSDQELSDNIRTMSYFQEDGQFSPKLYNAVLQRNRLTPEAFEQLQRKDLLTQKVKLLIDDSVKVSEDEVRRWYDWQNAEIKIKVAVFAPADFAGETPSQDALEQYFDEHKEAYKTPEKIQATYIRFDPAAFTSRVEVGEDEISQYYQDHQKDYRREKTVEASHILVRLDKNPSEEVVAEKEAEAMKLYEMVTSGGKDFADCAREFSDDQGSAVKGGSLGEFKKQDLVAPFAEKAFSMEPGEISRPVKTMFGWHVIKVDKVNEASVTPLDEAAPDIREMLALKKARELAYEDALIVFDEAINKDSVEQAARAFELEARTTPLFSRTDIIKDIPESSEFVQRAFELLEGQISDVTEIGDNYYLFAVDKRLAPEVPELSTVRQQVVDDLSEQMREGAAEKAAEDFLETLKDGADIDSAVETTPAELITTDYFKRQGAVPEIGNAPELSRQAFLLTADNPVAEKVINGSKGYYVFCLEDRRPPDQDAFSSSKDGVMKRLVQLKKQEAFSAWLSEMKAESEITRDERVLN